MTAHNMTKYTAWLDTAICPMDSKPAAAEDKYTAAPAPGGYVIGRNYYVFCVLGGF